MEATQERAVRGDVVEYGRPPVVQWSVQRREVVVEAQGEVVRFRLEGRTSRGFRWREWLVDNGGAKARGRVPVSRVVEATGRDRDAEEAVLEITRAASRELRRRGAAWVNAARVLNYQIRVASGLGMVPVEPFRARFLELAERDGLTPAMVAHRLGWAAGAGKPDTSRVLRRLGLRPNWCGRRGRNVVGSHVTYDTAVALCDALELDYHEVGV